jgi:hypothetical protein
MFMKKLLLVTVLLSCIIGCSTWSWKSIYSVDPENGISKVPESMSLYVRMYFDRYTSLTAPNGKSVSIIAQTQVSNEQMLRARNILSHYLTNLPGSEYGDDKTAVFNKMADNGAVLCLLNGSDDGKNLTIPPGQALYQNELPVEGDRWYIENDMTHRDAAFEEILHFVHDNGIGVDGKNSKPGALPDYQSEIRAAQENAVNKSLWPDIKNSSSWYKELETENSLTQEYLAAVIDSYYGLWAGWSDSTNPASSTKGMWGEYTAKTRAEIELEDSEGYKLVDKFFHPYIAVPMNISASFDGTFYMNFDKDIIYTHKSQYLKDIKLTGTNSISVHVNSLDNKIEGNSGTNTIIFSGNQAEYSVKVNSVGGVVVTDLISKRDGVNTLINCEALQFKDSVQSL